MQIEIRIEENCKEPKLILVTDRMTEEVNLLLQRLSETHTKTLIGFRNETLVIIKVEDIIRFFSDNQKIYAQTGKDTYTIKTRLYELEDKLDRNTFIRISNSEIINLNMVKNMDLSFSGTIVVNLQDNIKTYVLRRYVTKIKQILGV